jgi:ATP-dependent protease Clp ATPase subunit
MSEVFGERHPRDRRGFKIDSTSRDNLFVATGAFDGADELCRDRMTELSRRV